MSKTKPHGRRACRAQGADALTTADLIVLSLLAEQDMHGYELANEYERQEVADWASVSKAQVYYALQKLQTKGLIEPVPGADDAAGARDRTIYTPTAAGRAALTLALSDSDWARVRLPQPFLTWVGLSIHAERDASRDVIAARKQFLAQEIERGQATLLCIESICCPRARMGEVVLQLNIRQMQTELEWLDDLRRCMRRKNAVE